MKKTSRLSLVETPRILMVSLRNVCSHVSRCSTYEFEDAICNFDSVNMIVPSVPKSLFENTRKVAKQVGKAFNNGKLFNPLLQNITLDREYELLFLFCQHPLDILSLNSIRNRQEKCLKTVVWLDEIWVKEINKWQIALKLLKDVDYVFLNFSASVRAVTELSQRPCFFLPYGIDTVKFCPYPFSPRRNIDVLSLGRRSPIIHAALLELVKQRNFFYVHDTIQNLQTLDYKEHRDLYANLLKRSLYFIVNKAKFNFFQQTGGQEEFGSRFFEGEAGGAVMLGNPASCEAYRDYFNWSDAGIQIPDDAANIADIINDLNQQFDRLEQIRTNNIINSLLRNDWVYRWGKVLETVGLEKTSAMVAREAYLKNLAEMAVTPVAA